MQPKTQKRLSALMLCVILMLSVVLAACKKTNSNENTKYETVAQGGKILDGSNAKTLSVKKTDKGALATIQFVLGSANAGTDEAVSDSVPKYRAYMTGAPERLVLEFENLSSWDYDRTFALEDDDLFYSIFKQYQISENDERFRIIFQLRKNVTVKIEEKKDILAIDFSIKEERLEDQKENFFVMSDALTDFSKGNIPINSGLFPIICRDGQNVLLISAPFETQKEAEEFKKKTMEENSTAIVEKNTFVIALDGNDLPDYTSKKDLEVVYSQNVIERKGEAETLPVAMPDGMFLCSSADGTLTLFSKQLDDGSESEESTSLEELWILDKDGKIKRLSEIEFAMIDKAAFSPDGKKLAILERTARSSLLYIYNMETNSLETNLGEEGFGTTTSTFAWDELGTAIFAITGEEQQQLLKYDFTTTDETSKISAVEEQQMSEGDLGFFNGEIYFTNEDPKDFTEAIFKIKPEGGLRTFFAKGGSFTISSDGKNMAIMESALLGEDESTDNTTLKVKNMIDGKETKVIENAFVVNYSWSQDGYLYYSVGDDLGQDYGFKLIRYDIRNGESLEIARLKSSDFYTSSDPKLLYLTYISDDGVKIRATYKLKLD